MGVIVVIVIVSYSLPWLGLARVAAGWDVVAQFCGAVGFGEDLGKGVEGFEDTVSYPCILYCHVWIVDALEFVNTVMNYPRGATRYFILGSMLLWALVHTIPSEVRSNILLLLSK